MHVLYECSRLLDTMLRILNTGSFPAPTTGGNGVATSCKQRNYGNALAGDKVSSGRSTPPPMSSCTSPTQIQATGCCRVTQRKGSPRRPSSSFARPPTLPSKSSNAAFRKGSGSTASWRKKACSWAFCFLSASDAWASAKVRAWARAVASRSCFSCCSRERK